MIRGGSKTVNILGLTSTQMMKISGESVTHLDLMVHGSIFSLCHYIALCPTTMYSKSWRNSVSYTSVRGENREGRDP